MASNEASESGKGQIGREIVREQSVFSQGSFWLRQMNERLNYFHVGIDCSPEDLEDSCKNDRKIACSEDC